MAQTFSSREELKRDHLQEWVKSALDWIATNRQTFFSIAGSVVVAVIVVLFVVSNLRNLRKQAWERYSAGINWLFNNNLDNALNQFNDVLNNYPRTPAATYALLGKGDALYQQKKYPDAIEAYKQCVEKRPSELILPFALSGLGIGLEDTGDYTGAIENYKKFVSEFPDHFLTPKIYESLARCYELALNPDAAKETYERIITLFPSTLWAEKAHVRYQTLAPKPFEGASTQGQTVPVPQTK